MATVTLRNLGGSVVMVVPKKILSLVDLKAGSQVRIGVENGRVVIEPRAKPHYTLAGLLAKSPRKPLQPSRNDREWRGEGGPRGGRLSVLVFSMSEFNRVGLILVCPGTQGGGFAREHGFAVPLSGAGTRTQGVVLCNQVQIGRAS